MLREITSLEEMAKLPKGTIILNRYRLPEGARRRYNCPDDWDETTFRLSIRKGCVPYLIGQYGSEHRVKETDFRENDRYFVEMAK